GDFGVAVRTAGVSRELDLYLQAQLRTETSGGAYADLRAQFYQQLQGIYGQPGSPSTLETVFDNFTTSLQALTTSPDSTSARAQVLSTAKTLTQQLNTMTAAIQSLRTSTEFGLDSAVKQANDAMQQI